MQAPYPSAPEATRTRPPIRGVRQRKRRAFLRWLWHELFGDEPSDASTLMRLQAPPEPCADRLLATLLSAIGQPGAAVSALSGSAADSRTSAESQRPAIRRRRLSLRRRDDRRANWALDTPLDPEVNDMITGQRDSPEARFAALAARGSARRRSSIVGQRVDPEAGRAKLKSALSRAVARDGPGAVSWWPTAGEETPVTRGRGR